MKTRFPSILGVFAAILMVASFVVPVSIAAPAAVTADPGIMKWDTIITPGSTAGMNDILNFTWGGMNFSKGNEVLSMAVGNDGRTIVYVVRNYQDEVMTALLGANAPIVASPVAQGLAPNLEWGLSYGQYRSQFFFSDTMGISAITTRYSSLARTAQFPGGANLYQVAIAPDDPKIMVVSSDRGSLVGAPDAAGPVHLWITTDAGQNWELLFAGFQGGVWTGLVVGETIRTIDISPDYGGKRDIAFGTVGAAGNNGRWFVRSSGGFSAWTIQQNANGVAAVALSNINYYAIKFSPTYSGDSAVAIVYASDVLRSGAGVAPNGTWFNVLVRDLNLNVVAANGFMINALAGIEVRGETDPPNISPGAPTLNTVSLQLPSDFSGQSASLRRAYISTDAYGTPGTHLAAGLVSGIFRIDDTTRYVLMDTTTTPNKAIYTIAYFGTYASGKLLAGERLGAACTASVPTWFTDSPTTCPIPCWYPALKPTTGAGNVLNCGVGVSQGFGNGSALVAWNVDGSLGYVATGSLPYFVLGGTFANGGWGYLTAPGVPGAVPPSNAIGGPVFLVAGAANWFVLQTLDAVSNDESAFAISRNNGETWNQIVLIDTTVDWFNDVAIAPDCTTIYLASVNRNLGLFCNEFDSVWRSTINPNVAAPLPAVPPLGTYWERVYLRPSSINCLAAQMDLPILRVVNSCTDKKDGEIIGWAGEFTNAMAWSPDYGDYWAAITPRFLVQDFAFESSTTLYVVNPMGMVQRLPYTGTSWSTNLPSYQTNLQTAHTIVAVPDGKVLVSAGFFSAYPAVYSADKGVTFTTLTDAIAGHGNEHVIFDVDFKNNNFIYMGDDVPGLGGLGTVYRNTVPAFTRWVDNDMMAAGNGNGYVFAGLAITGGVVWPAGAAWQPPHIVGQFGLAQAWTGEPQPALYSAHDNITTSATLLGRDNSAVCRTLKPRDGMPKPAIRWACLDIFAPIQTQHVKFTLEPSSLKYCGCCTLDTNTTLYAIDDESGNWAYDPATGVRRAQAAPGALNGYLVTNGMGLSGRGWSHGSTNMLAWTGIMVGQFGPATNWIGYAPTWRQGMLWAYTDCLAKKGPILKTPADKFLVGADPVSGRNQQIDLSWEQLCLSTVYQLQIAKDAAFTLRINPAINWSQSGGAGTISAVTGSIILAMDATNMTSPAAWIAPGALPEAGAIYYWRIRSAQSATLQIADSPWSEVRSFTVKAGFIVNTPYYGVQLLAPNNGCLGCKIKPASFSWSPWKEATKYQFDLATDPEFKSLVVTATTTTTGYEYSGTLNYSTNYFWRVKALEVNGQNIPSDWSATFSMQTEPAPAPPAPPPAEPATPVWVWVIIAIGAILVIVTLVLIFKTRRV